MVENILSHGLDGNGINNNPRLSRICVLIIITILLILSFIAHSNLLPSDSQLVKKTIIIDTVKDDKFSQLLANIDQVTLKNFGIDSRLEINNSPILSDNSDIRLVDLSYLGDALGIIVKNSDARNENIRNKIDSSEGIDVKNIDFCEKYYRQIIGFVDSGLYISDPTEADNIYNNSVCSALVNIYRADIDSPRLEQALGFIAGELTMHDVLNILKAHMLKPSLDYHMLAIKWFNQHNQG